MIKQVTLQKSWFMKLLLKRSVMTVVAALVSSAFHFKSQRCLLIHFFPSKCLAKFVMFWLLGDVRRIGTICIISYNITF